MKKLILGVATNSGGKYKAVIDGKKAKSYATWQSMLTRCYCSKYQARKPTYIGCSVSDEWLDYQEFAQWFYDNPYSNLGYHLDKDLLVPNNKVYSPETACFVPLELNNLLAGGTSARDDLPQGVSFRKSSSKFRAGVCINGKQRWLGHFDTEQEAYNAYKMAKEVYVKRMALEWQDRIASDVFDALMSWELNPK